MNKSLLDQAYDLLRVGIADHEGMEGITPFEYGLAREQWISEYERIEKSIEPLQEYLDSECPECREYSYNVRDGICENCKFID